MSGPPSQPSDGANRYRKWDKTDRPTLETMKQVSDDFAVAFGEQLELLVQHDFVTGAEFLPQRVEGKTWARGGRRFR